MKINKFFKSLMCLSGVLTWSETDLVSKCQALDLAQDGKTVKNDRQKHVTTVHRTEKKHTQKKHVEKVPVDKKLSVDHPFNRALIATYNTNPQLRSQVKQQYVLTENIAKAFSGWRPDIAMQGTVGRSWADVESPAIQKGHVNTTNKSLQLTLNQNLYAGGQTQAQIAQAKATLFAGFATLKSTEQQTLLDTITAYLALWSKRTLLKLYTDNVSIKQKTLNQTQARFKVGELTLTDVSQAEAGLADAVAQQISAQADVNNAIETYLQSVGEMPGDVPPPPPLSDLRVMPASRRDVEERALKNHPDLRSAENTIIANYAAIDIAKSELLPSVDVKSQAGRNLASGDNAGRQNSAAVNIVLSIPIYQRGAEWSAIRQATETASKSKIDKVVTQRKVLQNAVQSWENWVSYAAQIKQLKIRIEADKLSVEGTRQENLVGERTILDVLTAENDLLKAQTNLTTTQQNYLLAGYAILAAIGELSANNLDLPVEAYPVEENYKYIDSQIIGIGSYPTR